MVFDELEELLGSAWSVVGDEEHHGDGESAAVGSGRFIEEVEGPPGGETALAAASDGRLFLIAVLTGVHSIQHQSGMCLSRSRCAEYKDKVTR